MSLGILDALKACEGVHLDEKLIGGIGLWLILEVSQGLGACALVSERRW